MHLSQVYTLLGDTRAAYRAEDAVPALASSPSVSTRALIAMDTVACLRVDGDLGEAAAMAAAVYDRLPPPTGAPGALAGFSGFPAQHRSRIAGTAHKTREVYTSAHE
ncbi:hypothetical protein AB4039_38270 [Streptomyces sp. M-16]|uniref:hypothetical protein n=1 Tax=Streptomyces sp. M-16 TaxID=3233040 RepID=UPI00224D40F2